MADTPKNDFEGITAPASGEAVGMDEIEAWFVREVLPLEAVLIQYLTFLTPFTKEPAHDETERQRTELAREKLRV